MNFDGKTIVIGITGGIAAYKACDLIRELYRRKAQRVICIMTPAAEAFITPLTLQALSRQPVYSSELAVDDSGVPVHITLAQQADALLILPASTDSIAKLSHGFADNLVTTTAITFTDKPILLAPAMNTRMWRNPLTQDNLQRLRQLPNVTVIEPCDGHLACGETGEGHLADQEIILRALYRAIHPKAGLFKGVKAIVTAGGTAEPIDPVRVISNRSSGKMGLAMADELHAMGAKVCLISTSRPSGLRPYEIVIAQTAVELQQTLEQRFETADLVVMAAAVSDFSVADPQAEKIKRVEGEAIQIDLVSNPDILAGLGQRKKPGQILVGFAAESRDLLENASEKLRRKNLDMIVANDISRSDIGFEAEENEVTLLFPEAPPITLEKAPKSAIARQTLLSLYQQVSAPLKPQLH